MMLCSVARTSFSDWRGLNDRLVAAIRHNDVDNVRSLLMRGADARFTHADISGQKTALHDAVEFNASPEVAQALLLAGADVDAPGPANASPLMQALRLGRHDMAQVLLDFGASVHVRDDTGWTPLSFIVRMNRPEDAALQWHNADQDCARERLRQQGAQRLFRPVSAA